MSQTENLDWHLICFKHLISLKEAIRTKFLSLHCINIFLNTSSVKLENQRFVVLFVVILKTIKVDDLPIRYYVFHLFKEGIF